MTPRRKVGIFVYLCQHIFPTTLFNPVTGGRNGYGAKLANIFSNEFVVETADSTLGQKYKQVFRNNMGDIGKPSITKASTKAKSDYTKITFKPDLARFKMTVSSLIVYAEGY